MRVAFLGNFKVPYTSENDYLWTMRERLGFDVVTLQEGEITAGEIEAAATSADVFLWVHTHGWETPGMGDVLDRLDARGVITAGYHLDLYMGLQRWQGYTAHDYFRVRHFFTVDKLMADWLNANTPTAGHFLRPGVVERDCYAEPADLTHGIVFVGCRRYHPEWPYREKLVGWLHSAYGDRFEHWGPHGKGLVRGADLNRLYASTKVVVGDTLCPGFDYPYYQSDRAYETLGRGGFLVHPRIAGMELEDGKHLALYDYGDFDGLRATIDHYLAADEEREAIRRQGHTKVKADCTYTHRLRSLFDTLEAARG